MYAAGEKPGIGTYICVMCHLEIIIESDNEELPRCPDCKASFYKRVS